MGFHRKITSLLDAKILKGTVFYGEAQRSMPLEDRLKDPGGFIYHEDGFEYLLKDGQRKIKWEDIDRLIAYKTDLNEICLDIVWGEWQTTITEQTPGWHQFIEKIKTVFPGMPNNWDTEMIQPPFAENRTILYQREPV